MLTTILSASNATSHQGGPSGVEGNWRLGLRKAWLDARQGLKLRDEEDYYHVHFHEGLHPFDYRGFLMSIAIVGECIEERQTLLQDFIMESSLIACRACCPPNCKSNSHFPIIELLALGPIYHAHIGSPIENGERPLDSRIENIRKIIETPVFRVQGV